VVLNRLIEVDYGLVGVLWHGHSCFELRGKSITIVTDPFKVVGIPDPKAAADIVLVSHGHRDHNNVKPVLGKDGQVLESFLGSEEVKGVTIRGVATFHDNSMGSRRGKNSIYTFDLDGVQFCHLGDLGHELSSSTVDDLGKVDVLFVPVGGFFTIGPETATKVCDQLKPKIIVPMHYRMPGLRARVMFGFFKPVDDFLKGKNNVERIKGASFNVEENELPKEAKIIVLSLE
jgi:L-ascorbate metabolism protein UlaG (beta-lactamase superfamily)